MDFKLIRLEEVEKVPVSVRIYSTVVEEMQRIADKEKISMAGFVRHALNIAIEQYKNTQNTQNTQKQG